METDFEAMNDVVVVGNGPAGAAACLALAARGLSPVWVTPAGVAPPAVGETLSVAGVQSLQQLGADTVLQHPDHRPENVVFSAWGRESLAERHAMHHVLGAGRVLHREVFNAQFAALADARARVVSSACVGFDAEAEGWRLALADGRVVRARCLIDATGRRATFGRRLTTWQRQDTLVAVQAILGPVPADCEPTPATLVESAANGWWYVTLLPTRRLALMYFSDADLLPPRVRRDPASLLPLLHETRHVSRWLRELGLALPGSVSLHPCGTAWLQSPVGIAAAGPAWAAVGDAALALDPLSSHGISSALWSAQRAAAGVAAWLAGEAQALQPYADALLAGRVRYGVERLAMYSQETRFAQQPFWRRRQAPVSAGG